MSVVLLRLIGVTLALLSGTVAGAQWSTSLARRVRELAEFRAALLALETDISYALTPLSEACLGTASRTSGESTRRFFGRVGALMTQDRLTASQAWARAIAESEPSSFLWWSDWEPLRRLGQVLGLSGREEHLRHLALARASLEAVEADARQRSAQLGKVYRYAGLAASVLAILLFL